MEELRELMVAYARRGLLDWKRTSNDIKWRAKKCLANRIAEASGEADQTIRAAFQGGANILLNFIPMPNVPEKDNDSLRSFFLPFRIRQDDDVQRAAFDLFILVDTENCLGFRFEPADSAQYAHNYTHVQMNKRMLNKSMEVVGIPNWIPTSYPALPIRTSGPLQMFLAMATAVHGRDARGVSQVIREALVGNTRVSKLCVDQLAEMYG